ncbi:MAG: type II restriction enzyme [Pyrinomonadaceae bacterium]
MSANSESGKNDIAWAELFNLHPILERIDEKGFYEISAKDINKFREARLATKFDFSVNLPALFKRHKLTIQPTSRGKYILGRFDSYQPLTQYPTVPIISLTFPPDIETINPERLDSEASAILCAHAAGIIKDVLEDDVRLTVMGRMGSGTFRYHINEVKSSARHEIRVDKAQVEIDGGFEGSSRLAIIEAKNLSPDDFLIRQLYYPYRLWTSKGTKEIVPIYMTYSNEVFSFYVFRFSDTQHYNSIELVEQRRYQIVPSDIEIQDLTGALERAHIVPEPTDAPFPQADKFTRIIDLLTLLHTAPRTQDYLTTYNVFDVRQTQYYTNAAAYLGLVERRYDREQSVSYALTTLGRRVMNRRPQTRNLAIIELILAHRVFNEALRLYLNQSARPSKQQVTEIMQREDLGLDREGTTTIPRRARTVLGWLDWMMDLTRA